MSCIFCDSVYHLSQNCTVYACPESRDYFVKSKKRCFSCLLPQSDGDHSIRMPKCYICFSQQHNTALCRDPDSQIFLPKINDILLPRFFATLGTTQYSLAFSSPKALKVKTLKPLVISPSVIDRNFGRDYPAEYNLLANWAIAISESQKLRDKLLDLCIQKSFINKARIISLYSITNLSVQLLLQLLTPFTLEFSCKHVKFDSSVKFSDILERIPNIEKLNFLYNKNAEIENTWPETLLKCKNGNNFRGLLMTVENFDFNLEALAGFMKTKMCDHGKIELVIIVANSGKSKFREFRKETEQRLKVYFATPTAASKFQPKLKIIYGPFNSSDSFELVCK